MIIRQSIYILSIITKEMGKLKTHSPTYCILVSGLGIFSLKSERDINYSFFDWNIDIIGSFDYNENEMIMPTRGVLMIINKDGHKNDWNNKFLLVIIIAMTSWWARWRPNLQASRLFTQHLFMCRSKKTSTLCVTGLCEGNPPMTGGSRAKTSKIYH